MNIDKNKKEKKLLLPQTQLGKSFGKFNWEGAVYRSP